MRYCYICIIAMFISIPCFTQMRPLPAVLVCQADELDIHQQDIETKARLEKIVNDMDLLDKLSIAKDKSTLYEIECSRLRIELDNVKEQRKLEKKIAGIAGLLLFASGNESLKNIGLVSLFCWSIW